MWQSILDQAGLQNHSCGVCKGRAELAVSSYCLCCVYLVLQADQAMNEENMEKKKKRTFRKYTYRGVDLDQLLDMSK